MIGCHQSLRLLFPRSALPAETPRGSEIVTMLYLCSASVLAFVRIIAVCVRHAPQQAPEWETSLSWSAFAQLPRPQHGQRDVREQIFTGNSVFKALGKRLGSDRRRHEPAFCWLTQRRQMASGMWFPRSVLMILISLYVSKTF